MVIQPHQIKIKMKNALGDSFIFENPEEIKPGEKWEAITEDYIKEILTLSTNISRRRGEILSKAVYLDDGLNDVIRSSLFGQNITPSSEMFENIILKTDFFMSMSKWKVLREIAKKHEKLKEKDYSLLMKTIHNLIEIRDKFAHGIVIFRGKKALLSYYKGGIKEDELTDDYFNKIIGFFKEASLGISEMISILIGGGESSKVKIDEKFGSVTVQSLEEQSSNTSAKD